MTMPITGGGGKMKRTDPSQELPGKRLDTLISFTAMEQNETQKITTIFRSETMQERLI